ncbi:C-terminal binding protein [Micromonospora echinofusca]|uniref:C-terminal binding protein n=1 Tax=Micromonospora echinofusca TaxID=47858 RepID=A0ABS3VVH0_MICEH|nr:C-terminal binding protein [Micromonospora echinofusca]MBO4208529.1 C-terminal binding protein [Micromonospora echinofusca]
MLEPAGFEVRLATAGDEATLVAAAAEARAILTCFAPVTEPVIAAAPDLAVIARLGAGIDNIDVEAARRRGIAVTRVPDYCVDEVATHTVALALALWRRLPQYDAATRAGRWGVASDLPMRRLAGARAMVLGRGRIGSAVADRLGALGFEIANEPDGCHLLTVHVPLTDRTRNLVDGPLLHRLAPGAVLVNTSRGAVVDLPAAVRALDEGQLTGLGLDVFPREPLSLGDPLLARPDVLLTPHVAFYTEQSLAELRRRAATSVLDHVRPQPELA